MQADRVSRCMCADSTEQPCNCHRNCFGTAVFSLPATVLSERGGQPPDTFSPSFPARWYATRSPRGKIRHNGEATISPVARGKTYENSRPGKPSVYFDDPAETLTLSLGNINLLNRIFTRWRSPGNLYWWKGNSRTNGRILYVMNYSGLDAKNNWNDI